MIKQLARPLVAFFLAGLLVAGPISPAFAQSSGQDQQPTAPAPKPAAQASTMAPVGSLQLSSHNYTRAPRPFPNLLNPYNPIKVEAPNLSNSPRIEQLIHDGNLQISLQDAVELALENNLDIVVQRYNPWIADTDILRTLGGGVGRGISGTGTASSLGNIPALNFDPVLSSTVSFDDRRSPINNPFISGTGTTTLASITTHTAQYNTQYSQGFHTGTTFFTTWNNTRSSSSSPSNLFNPSVQSSLFVGFSQELLNGFGILPNTRNIMIAKHSRKIADLQFAQQAITTITNTINTYWELVFAVENVKVQQRAVTVAEKLYSDNKKQLEIGTMAPLDVVRAQSELATDRQNLIVAQTALLQQQQALINAISKNPLAPKLINVEIIPKDRPTQVAQVETPNFEDAIKEAFAKRPDLQQMVYSLKIAGINVRATRNALLPTATISAQYGTVGLGGNALPTATALTNPFVQANGATGVVLDTNGLPVFIPSTVSSGTVVPGGLGDALHQAFHNSFPDYNVQLSITVPIRNRPAQA